MEMIISSLRVMKIMIDPIPRPRISFWDRLFGRDTLKKHIEYLELYITQMNNAVNWQLLKFVEVEDRWGNKRIELRTKLEDVDTPRFEIDYLAERER